MMDEQLIDEVAQHGVIFNRQKYYLNGSNGPGGMGGKYETKDEAWQTIAIKLRTDVETCKKRWKYLRERYVSQRKQGDPPVYEHLSRPYLEKMKFLDQHIQPRKSYRNVPNFLTSPHSVNSSNYSEFNMDSKSNGSLKNLGHFGSSQHHYHQPDPQHAMNALSSAAVAASGTENGNGHVKIEADQMFRDFAAAVASQQLQQISQTQLQHQQAAAVAAAMADSSQNYNEHYRDSHHMTNGNGVTHNGNGGGMAISSSSSSMKSPLSSPLDGVNGNQSGANHTSGTQQAAAHSSSSNHMSTHAFGDSNNDEMDSSTNYHESKKPRVQLNSNANNMPHNSNHTQQQQQQPGAHETSNSTNAQHYPDDSDDDSDDNSHGLLQPQTILNGNQNNHYDGAPSTSTAAATHRSSNSGHSNQQQGMFPANADFLFQLYHQLPHQQQSPTTPQQPTHLNKFQVPQNPAPPRSSEHLLGELVTTELLKMTKERRKTVQKRILEILFFDD
uniref:MADF domain-containing protein n=1 Tax=Ceratitis capitata TaxID=7213 RepID=W8BGB7_CERCA